MLLRSDKLPPTRRGRLTKERAKFCELVAGGMRPVEAFRKTWPEKSRAAAGVGSHETLRLANELMRNPAVQTRLAELFGKKIFAS